MRYLSEDEMEILLLNIGAEDNVVFLDSSRCDTENSHSYLFTREEEVLEFFPGDDVASFFLQIEERLAQGLFVAGTFDYEFGLLLEEVLAPLCSVKDKPLIRMGVFKERRFFNHLTGETDFPLKRRAGTDADVLYEVLNVVPSVSYPEYERAIRQIKEYIAAGDTYQVNYTFKLLFEMTGDIRRLYVELRRNQSVGYGGYLKFGQDYTLSFSPELFFKKHEKKFFMRPMKGTMKKGNTLAESISHGQFLQGDLKNRSENVMIVDLLRNDLGHLVSGQGGGDVSVPRLFAIEEYERLLQMTSTVIAELKSNAIDLQSVFQALFPCGSITGAPKIRTMQIIDELESNNRGVYTGAIGYFAPDGDSMFNVPIRTVICRDGKGEMGIGSGIVFDSNPEDEWHECLLKADFLTRPVNDFLLIETILWQKGEGYFLLQEHLDRLASSAQFFSFYCDLKRLRAELESYEDLFGGEQAVRLRLTLAKTGETHFTYSPCHLPDTVEITPTQVQTDGLPVIRLYENPVDTCSPWFYHKTSRRELFNEQFVMARQEGCVDTIFVNLNGEVTEGCISNIIVQKNGYHYTPPLSSGLLDGVMRRVLLGDGGVIEKRLKPEELVSADALYLCNSVRGVRRVLLNGPLPDRLRGLSEPER